MASALQHSVPARSPARGAPAGARRVAYRILGPRRYLWLVSAGFFAALRLGLLRGRPAFDAHYFLPNLVRAGDTAIDIGANLGYYTLPLGRLVGPGGRVIAVEPVALYRRLLEQRSRRLAAVEVLPYALGAEDGITVRLGLPDGADPYRHGLTRVMDGTGTFSATMRRPSILFADLARLDFIKCDVEGYETIVLPEMLSVIQRHMPILQVETEGSAREIIVRMLLDIGYRAFVVRGELLVRLEEDADAAGDVVFVPPARLAALARFLSA